MPPAWSIPRARSRSTSTCDPVEGIWAAGDVTGIQFTPIAQYQARIAMDDMFGRAPVADYTYLPTAIFTDPEIAAVGLTEAEARGAGSRSTRSYTRRASARAVHRGEAGLFKVVFDPGVATDRSASTSSHGTRATSSRGSRSP